LNAQLVTAAGIEPGEHFALLADLLEAARQLVGGGNLDGDITTIADEVVLRSPPLPCLQPAGDLERQRAKALRRRRSLRARAPPRRVGGWDGGRTLKSPATGNAAVSPARPPASPARQARARGRVRRSAI